MADHFNSEGGLNLGGQSPFFVDYIPGCNLLVPEDGLMILLDTLSAAWEGVYTVSLFQNDLTPYLTMPKSALIEAAFSGYASKVPLYGWSASVIQGVRAENEALPVSWIHDGGPVSCWVFGYYVLDGAGNLVWAERLCPAPWPMVSIGQRVRVLPRMTLRNEFPREVV